MGFVLGVDAGGTFIDYFLMGPQGQISYKSPAQPRALDYGILQGLSGLAAGKGLTLERLLQEVELIVHGTTVTTNAVLTTTGAKTALLTTEGLIDLLEMRQGVRDDLYNNHQDAPVPLVDRWMRIPIRERMDFQGKVLTALDEERTYEQLQRLAGENIEAVAVVLAHSYINPGHERKLQELIQRYWPELYVSLSYQVLPQAHMYRRVSTTVLNAYVAPILDRYLRTLLQQLTSHGFRGEMWVMQSNGGTFTVEEALELPVMSLLSGPAAAPSLVRYLDTNNQFADAIVMDMGGTSFDVSLVRNGHPGTSTSNQIGGQLIGLPVIDIHTIGAGGGSIAWIDKGGLLHIGPASAGARPGPACYGQGGQQPTCTDADLLLGLINPDYFLGGRLQLDRQAAVQAMEEHIARPLNMEVTAAAQGIYQLVNTAMAAGIKEITLEKGYDPRKMTLVVGGGAGPLHAASVARELGISRLLIPRESSVMCALGMLYCGYRRDYYQYFHGEVFSLDIEQLQAVYQELWEHACRQAGKREVYVTQKRVHMRYQGQHYDLAVDIKQEPALDQERLARLFHQHHYALYGYDLADLATDIELTGVSIVVEEASGLAFKQESSQQAVDQPLLKAYRQVLFDEQEAFQTVPVYAGDALPVGGRIKGPALVEQPHSTVVVPEGFVLICKDERCFMMISSTAREGE